MRSPDDDVTVPVLRHPDELRLIGEIDCRTGLDDVLLERARRASVRLRVGWLFEADLLTRDGWRVWDLDGRHRPPLDDERDQYTTRRLSEDWADRAWTSLVPPMTGPPNVAQKFHEEVARDRASLDLWYKYWITGAEAWIHRHHARCECIGAAIEETRRLALVGPSNGG